MIVIDASVLANAFTDDGPVGQRSRAELARDAHWAAPEHLVVETFSAIRGRHLGRRISRQRALDALDALATSAIERLSTTPLLPRMWQLRDNVTGYDAAYVAAAETYDCPLLTTDARLAHATDLRCEIRLAVPSAS
ncbi:MAG: type II toxin-antitoxin system VapC family toxin [Nocardioides sp.]